MYTATDAHNLTVANQNTPTLFDTVTKAIFVAARQGLITTGPINLSAYTVAGVTAMATSLTNNGFTTVQNSTTLTVTWF